MRIKFLIPSYIILSVLSVCMSTTLFAQTDTLRVMAYNVLNYGEYPLCQGPNSVYNAYLETIVRFADPDVLSLEKMGSIQTSPSDHNYTAVIGFQDSILKYALNAAYPGRYACCPFTNYAASQTEGLLFYDQNKLGFVAITCTYTNTEDFNTYKLYYKDPNLATTHDTTYLYVTVNHDISGSSSGALRGAQIAGEISQIQGHFSHLANMINMGDFNLRTTSEPCYQTLTQPADTNFRYYDPPFYPDASLTYPANWDANPGAYAKYLTTSTRASGSVPNSCGTSGGGKDWFDHIFLSPWIIGNANYIQYIPNSFRVIGNDGSRVGISINDAPTNTAAPDSVIEALFQMSNKYPVMVDLAVSPNTTGVSPPDPERPTTSIVGESLPKKSVSVVNPVHADIILHVSDNLIGHEIFVKCADALGRILIDKTILVDNGSVTIPCKFIPGVYYINITDGIDILTRSVLTKY